MDLAKQWYNDVRQNWREAAAEEHFAKVFLGNFLFCFALYMAVIQWLKYNSSRSGTVINDPTYYFLQPHDFSLLIALCTYSVIILGLLYLAQYPYLLHRGFTAFTAIFVVRAFCIFMVPLSPSSDMLTLHDPFTNMMAGEDSITNDLFFSGHVADLAFFAFIVSHKWAKRYIILATVCLAVMLVWQRVHYTLDVVAAPVFAYFCFWAFVEKDIIWSSYLKKTEDGKSSPGHVL